MYDFHTHINSDQLFPNRQEHVARFIKAWWKWLISVGVDDIYNQRNMDIIDIHKKDPMHCDIRISLWFHPCMVDHTTTIDIMHNQLDRLAVSIDTYKDFVMSIGECWIDKHYTQDPDIIKLQSLYFDEQCKLWIRMWLPVMIHSRDAFDETMAIIKKYPTCVFYFHCRTYSPQQLAILLQQHAHIYVWITWIVTYKKGQDVRDSVLLLDDDVLLLETDAPYLSPEWVRQFVNEPSYISYIYKYVSALRWSTYESLCIAQEKNRKRLCLPLWQ